MKWTTSSPNWNQNTKINEFVHSCLPVREPVFLQMMQLLLHFRAVIIGKSICMLVLFTFGIHCTSVRSTFLDKLFFNENLHVSHIVPVDVGKYLLNGEVLQHLLWQTACFWLSVAFYTHNTHTSQVTPLLTRTQIPLKVGETSSKM